MLQHVVLCCNMLHTRDTMLQHYGALYSIGLSHVQALPSQAVHTLFVIQGAPPHAQGASSAHPSLPRHRRPDLKQARACHPSSLMRRPREWADRSAAIVGLLHTSRGLFLRDQKSSLDPPSRCSRAVRHEGARPCRCGRGQERSGCRPHRQRRTRANGQYIVARICAVRHAIPSFRRCVTRRSGRCVRVV